MLIILLAFSFSRATAEVADVKTCLAQVYKAQSATRSNSAAYATSLEQIALESV